MNHLDAHSLNSNDPSAQGAIRHVGGAGAGSSAGDGTEAGPPRSRRALRRYSSPTFARLAAVDTEGDIPTANPDGAINGS